MKKIEMILGLFLGIIISTVAYLVFLELPNNGFYYLLLVNERFIMVLYLTIGILISFGLLSIIVLIIIFRKWN